MSFTSQMRQWAKNTGQDTDDLVRSVNLELTRQVIQLTPVGNPDLWKPTKNGFKRLPPAGYTGGQAKANWFATTGAPSSSIAEDARARNESIPLRKAKTAINQSAGKVFYIVNNLPYIRPIEYEGHSTQAPNGMVRITVSKFNRLIEQKARQTKRKPKIR